MYLQQFTEHFPIYVECMKSTEHDSSYHLEGSVWTHTCMVYSAIKSFRPDSRVLLIAAILHDLGKIKTKLIKLNGNGSFHSHEGLSTFLATDILPLWDLSFSEKRDILNLISLHGVNTAQLQIPYLTMFRQADTIGRISSKISGEYEPRNFRRPNQRHTHTITFLCGLPCSGKSTYAKSLNTTIISRDDYLMDNFSFAGESYTDCYNSVHSDPLLKRELDEGFNVYILSIATAQVDAVIDMTMLSLSSRRSMMAQFPNAQFNCIVLFPRLSLIESRNVNRHGKVISDDVMFNMMKSFVMPVREEGFASINYILD